MIRWTPEKVQELRDIAHLGAARIAEKMGSTEMAIQNIALRKNISLKRAPAVMAVDRSMAMDERALTALRSRWAELIGPMKERLRADVIGS